MGGHASVEPQGGPAFLAQADCPVRPFLTALPSAPRVDRSAADGQGRGGLLGSNRRSFCGVLLLGVTAALAADPSS
jgi:hypothetical protein